MYIIGSEVKNMYCAIIGDIVKSKEIPDRMQAQKDLEAVLEKVNKQYKDDIASGFTITLGDEFQGLLHSTQNVLSIIEEIKNAMHPIKLRLGIGIGDIDTEIQKEKALGADGPAYYNARDAVNKLKEGEKKNETPKQSVLFSVSEKENQHLDLVNAALSLCHLVELGWTEKQRRMYNLMKQNNSSQVTVAGILDVNKSSVQKSIEALKYYNYTSASKQIQESINQIWEKSNDK